MLCQAGFIELAVIDTGRDTVLVPFASFVIIAKSGSGDDTIDTLAAVAAKMQFLPIDLIDYEVGGRDGELAMNAGARARHGLKIKKELTVYARAFTFKLNTRTQFTLQAGHQVELVVA